MPIKRIQITNMARFEAFDHELPMVCLIEGGNGAGKTGLLDCVRFLGESGHDPDIIHGDADSGEIILTMDDGMQLRARVTRGETWRGWKPKDGKRWIKGREEIEKIYRAIAYDPMKFLDLSPKAQAELLAQLSPVQATEEELAAAVMGAEDEVDKAQIRPGMTGIEFINALSKAIYDARTPLNVGADTQEKHAAELERSALPPEPPTGATWESRAEALRREKENLEADQRQKIADLNTQFNDAKQGAEQSSANEQLAINRDINGRIANLEDERRRRIEESDQKAAQGIEHARRIATDLAAEIREEAKPQLEKLAADLAVAQERARAHQQAEGARKAVAIAREEAKAKRARSEVLTGALERLSALKLALASKMPIKGAIVEGDKIVREQDGGLVPLKRWNTADQILLCLKIGMMVGGGFVCIDHFESFDGPHREGLIRTARKYADEKGIQFILAAVDVKAGELSVTDQAR